MHNKLNIVKGFLLISICLIASCTNIKYSDESQGSRDNIFYAISGEDSKTVLNLDYTVDWCQGDSIMYYSIQAGTIYNHIVPFSGHATSFAATLEGNTNMVAVYGASSVTDHDFENLTVQTKVNGVQSGLFKDGHVSVSKIDQSATHTLSFKNLTSFIHISTEDEDVKYIIFRSLDGSRIHGDGRMTVSLSDTGYVAHNIVDSLITGQDSTAIKAFKNGDKDIYIAMLPCEIESFQIESYDEKGNFLGRFRSEKKLSIPQNAVIDIKDPLLKEQPDWFRFTAAEEQYVQKQLYMYSSTAKMIEYSYDVKNWTRWDGTDVLFGVEGKYTIYFRGLNRHQVMAGQFIFKNDVPVYCHGNIMTLIEYREEPKKIDTRGCFAALFMNCKQLVTPPDLPATKILGECYYNMFCGCTSLIEAPDLPATYLPDLCYSQMFEGCSSLTETPHISATSVYMNCCSRMFKDCTSLVTAHPLPAACHSNSYASMFWGCTSLEIAPYLPATSLMGGPGAYYKIFYGCSKLRYVKCDLISLKRYGVESTWMEGVAPTGVFVKNPDATYDNADLHLPEGWTIVTSDPE